MPINFKIREADFERCDNKHVSAELLFDMSYPVSALNKYLAKNVNL
jgi:hypothetical protein